MRRGFLFGFIPVLFRHGRLRPVQSIFHVVKCSDARGRI